MKICTYIYICIYIYICVCVCVCVCMGRRRRDGSPCSYDAADQAGEDCMFKYIGIHIYIYR